MQLYDVFRKEWFADMDGEKISKDMAYSDCKRDWGFDFHRMKSNDGNPHVRSYFKFCNGSECCPVQKMIIYLKDLINPHTLVAFINKLYHLNYTMNK
ncbi:MAG: hypothetical protein HY063_12215 [Bacteroidetes bacterium]|nr:hypothetical protein [Bacteroidota bacterium]